MSLKEEISYTVKGISIVFLIFFSVVGFLTFCFKPYLIDKSIYFYVESKTSLTSTSTREDSVSLSSVPYTKYLMKVRGYINERTIWSPVLFEKEVSKEEFDKYEINDHYSR